MTELGHDGYRWEQFGAWIRDVPASCLGCSWVWSEVGRRWTRFYCAPACAWHRPPPEQLKEGRAA